MPSLDLYLHDWRVGVLTPDARNPSCARLAIDADYDPDAGVLLFEAQHHLIDQLDSALRC